MVSEKIKLSDLTKFSETECEESIGILRYTLLTAQDKTVINEIRLYIHKLEARLNYLSKNQSVNYLSYFNNVYYNLGY